MKIKAVCAIWLLACCSIFAQDPSPSATKIGTAVSQSSIAGGIESALQKYASSYEQRSINDLLAIWPNLRDDRKELNKIKKQFEDSSVSNVHVSLHPLESQVLQSSAVVRCDRIEQFSKIETSEGGGDLMRDRIPAQASGPHTTTKTVKKKDTLWFKLYKNDDNWVITGVGSKQPSL